VKKLIELNSKIVITAYILIDLICAGAGMGVPFFCILLGFPLGWYIARREFISTGHSPLTNSRILKLSLLAASFTFLIMLVIWGSAIALHFDQKFDFKNFGHPFILYDPKISFYGWLVLMIIISPCLQLLTTVFAAFIVLTKGNQKKIKSA
jgi:hypothetical protein